MAETTMHYGLKCPSETDYYNVEDQNENMRKIDEAIDGAVNVGVYVGDGEKERFIELPRTPKFVFILMDGYGLTSGDNYITFFGGMAIRDNPAVAANDYIIIEEGGFRLRHLGTGGTSRYANVQINISGNKYLYLWG